MLWHLPRPATPVFLEEIKRYGWTGVDLFFVLSGYLIGTHGAELLFGSEAMTGSGGFAIYFSSSIAAGALLWLIVERPFLLLRDRICQPL